MTANIVLKLNPEQADIDPIINGLIEYNNSVSGRDPNYHPFAFHLLDPESGKPVGGASGRAVFDWVFLELLHIPEQFRGRGMGRALMERVEAFAREHHSRGIWLDTFSFQARPFYEKMGFVVFGTIDDHPIGGHRFFMQKLLISASTP